MNVLREDDDDQDEDITYHNFITYIVQNTCVYDLMRLQRFLDSLAVFHLYKDSPLYRRLYRCIDMLGHINEGENE